MFVNIRHKTQVYITIMNINIVIHQFNFISCSPVIIKIFMCYEEKSHHKIFTKTEKMEQVHCSCYKKIIILISLSPDS